MPSNFLSQITQLLPEPLQQPGRLGLLSSVIFHGLLFVGLPLLPVSSRTASDRDRVVQLVDLSPAEQSRLPQFASPQTSLLPNGALSSLPPNLPNLTQVPETSLNQPLQPFNAFPQTNLPPLTNSRPSVVTIPDTIAPPPQSFFSSPRASNSQVAPLPEFTPPPDDPVIDFGPPIANSEGSGEEDQPGFLPGLDPQNPTPSDNANPTEFEQWLAKARQEAGSNVLPQSIKIPVRYPEAACEQRPQGLASVAILVKPDGTVGQDPEFMEATGAAVLDDAAIAAIEDYAFPASGGYQAYLATLDFTPTTEACPEPTTPKPAPGDAEKLKPTSAPTPSPTPSPKPSPSPSPKLTPSPAPAKSSSSPSPQPTSQSSQRPLQGERASESAEEIN